MDKAKSVIEFYVLCNKLKNVVRTGWKDWNVRRERVESVAEHIYGTQMLAIAMWSEYQYNINLEKVLCMLAIHELEETIIGDLTQFQIDRETKQEIGHTAIRKILSGLFGGKYIEDLILEFDERQSVESIFAYQCDKLECDLQSKLYDEEGCVDLTQQENNLTSKNAEVQRYLSEGKSWGEMWILFGQQRYGYDKNFLEVSNHALKNSIKKKN